MSNRVEQLLQTSNESSARVRNLWIAFLLFGTYLAIAIGGGGRFAEKVSHAEERGERTGGGRVDGLDALVQRRKVAADVARDQDLDRVRVGHLARELKMARCP